jgi:G3E family GTPase
MRYTIDGVVTVVDAGRASALLQDEPEARRQVLFADRVVLSKTGALSAEALEGARQAVRAVNAGAPILDGSVVEAQELVDIAPKDGADAASRTDRWLGAEAAAIHDGEIRSAALWRDAPLPHGALPLFTELLASAHGARILRLKGLLALADDPGRPVVIHGVQHVFERPRRLEAWPDDDHRSRIVVIARDLDPELLARIYDAFAGVPAIDAPDRAALIDNPLVPGSGGFIR